MKTPLALTADRPGPRRAADLLALEDASATGASSPVREALDAALDGEDLSPEQCFTFVDSEAADLAHLCRVASIVRDQGRGRDVTFSPKVFIPLTHLCRDFCGYCTFRQSPDQASRLYMTPSEVLDVARKGAELGCTEALFTLGERPEQRYPEAGEWLKAHGFKTTLDYLAHVSKLVLDETSLLPHANPGTMSRREMEHLRDVNASMGIMVESLSPRLSEAGGPHEHAPSKRPSVRVKTLEIAGEQKVAFTTGILIGIGETRRERVESLLELRELHRRYGHIQEVIIQNFRAKPQTPMADQMDASTEDLLWTTAAARLILGPTVNLQVPPNLSYDDYPIYLMAGINDWGGVSPLTIDFVNPEAPWPQIADLRQNTEALGFNLRPRLPVYPEYITGGAEFIPESLRERVFSLSDDEGYVKGGIDRYAS